MVEYQFDHEDLEVYRPALEVSRWLHDVEFPRGASWIRYQALRSALWCSTSRRGAHERATRGDTTTASRWAPLPKRVRRSTFRPSRMVAPEIRAPQPEIRGSRSESEVPRSRGPEVPRSATRLDSSSDPTPNRTRSVRAQVDPKALPDLGTSIWRHAILGSRFDGARIAALGSRSISFGWRARRAVGSGATRKRASPRFAGRVASTAQPRSEGPGSPSRGSEIPWSGQRSCGSINLRGHRTSSRRRSGRGSPAAAGRCRPRSRRSRPCCCSRPRGSSRRRRRPRRGSRGSRRRRCPPRGRR